MDNLKIALIQSSIFWQDTDANLMKFSSMLKKIEEDTDIVVLPEMFSTGFTMQVRDLTKPVGKQAFEWMKKQAASMNKILTGSILTESKNRFYNRMYWVKPDGTYSYYDKRHLFHMAGEHEIMTAGEERKIVEHKGWRFHLQICYDLRFPVWAKNHFNPQKNTYDYDVLIYIANWPQVRKQAYISLLQARAIENQAFVIWVNRIGNDGNNMLYSGDTRMIDPYGKIQKQSAPHQENILYVRPDAALLHHFREKFTVGLDWDTFVLDL
jgi:predicted amidohydrolase